MSRGSELQAERHCGLSEGAASQVHTGHAPHPQVLSWGHGDTLHWDTLNSCSRETLAVF